MTNVSQAAREHYPDPRSVSDDIEDMYTEDVVVEREQDAFIAGVEYASVFHRDHLDSLRQDIDSLADSLDDTGYHPDSYS